MKKVIFNSPQPTLTVFVTVPAHDATTPGGQKYRVAKKREKVVLNKGINEVEDRVAKHLADDPNVIAMVNEGTMRLPDFKALDKGFNSKNHERIERQKRLSAQQDEYKKEGEAERTKDAEIAELKAQAKESEKRAKGLEARLAKLEGKAPTKKSDGPTPVKSPKALAAGGQGTET